MSVVHLRSGSSKHTLCGRGEPTDNPPPRAILCAHCERTSMQRQLDALPAADHGMPTPELREAALAAPYGAVVTCPACGRRDYVKRAPDHLSCPTCARARLERINTYRAKNQANAATVYEPRKNGMQSLNRRNRFAQR